MSVDLKNIKNNIEQLNTIIQPEAQLELMLVLWSNFSPYSKKLLQEFNNEIRGYFYYINIDNPIIRKKIIHSKIMKISSVPTIITFTKSGITNTYEGYQRCIDIVKFIFNIHTVLNEKRMEKRYKGETPLSSIINIPEQVRKEMLEESDVIEEPTFTRDEPEEDEEEEMERKSRKKIKNARIPMKPAVNIDPRDMNLTMGGYNRPEINDIKKENKIVDLSGIEADIINENIDEMFGNDPTLDPDIRDIQNRTGKTMKGIVDTNEKHPFESVKKVADEMAMLRDKEVTEHDMKMRGKTSS